MNWIELMGRLGGDVETRFTSSGQKVSTFRIACNSKRGGQEETTWYRVTLWGDRWDKLLPYLTKGSALVVRGTLKKPEIYTDRNGQAAVSLEVTAETINFNPFGGRSDEQQQQPQQQQGFGAPPQAPAAPAAALNNDPWGSPAQATQPQEPAFSTMGAAPSQGTLEEDNVPF